MSPTLLHSLNKGRFWMNRPGQPRNLNWSNTVSSIGLSRTAAIWFGCAERDRARLAIKSLNDINYSFTTMYEIKQVWS